MTMRSGIGPVMLPVTLTLSAPLLLGATGGTAPRLTTAPAVSVQILRLSAMNADRPARGAVLPG